MIAGIEQTPAPSAHVFLYEDVATIDFDGSLFFDRAQGLKALLAETIDDDMVKQVELDMQGVLEIDGSILCVIVGGYKQARELGKGFFILNPQDRVARILSLPNLQFLDIEQD